MEFNLSCGVLSAIWFILGWLIGYIIGKKEPKIMKNFYKIIEDVGDEMENLEEEE